MPKPVHSANPRAAAAAKKKKKKKNLRFISSTFRLAAHSFQNDMAEIKAVGVPEIMPILSKITDHKLSGSNYLDWSKTIRLFLRSIDKDDHLTDTAPSDESKQAWLREDARLFLQIRNSIGSEVIGLVNHCEFVKELMDYLDFLYSGKGNLSRMFDVCKAFYRAENQDQSLTTYFMEFKKIYEELNMLLPFSADVKVQQQQREQMAIMSFLAGLPSTFDTAMSQIISGSDISSLQEVFSRVLRTEGAPSNPVTGALLSRNTHSSSRPAYYKPGAPRNSESRPTDTAAVTCNYCKKPGHTIQECRKLQYKNQKNPSAHAASSDNNLVRVPADEYAKFFEYQESLRTSKPSVTAIAEPGNPNTCLISSSSKWVIDSGATYHMTGNSKLFSTLTHHASASTVT